MPTIGTLDVAAIFAALYLIVLACCVWGQWGALQTNYVRDLGGVACCAVLLFWALN